MQYADDTCLILLAVNSHTKENELKNVEQYTQANNMTIAQLVGQHEDSLFQAILDDESHVIHHLLPPSVSNTYNLRPRRHQRQLTIKPDNKNFLTRKLYEDIY